MVVGLQRKKLENIKRKNVKVHNRNRKQTETIRWWKRGGKIKRKRKRGGRDTLQTPIKMQKYIKNRDKNYLTATFK